jgi:hypothetical protein
MRAATALSPRAAVEHPLHRPRTKKAETMVGTRTINPTYYELTGENGSHTSCSSFAVRLILAITVNYLPTTSRAPLNVATPNMYLALRDSAIMTGTPNGNPIGTPILSLAPIPDPRKRFACYLDVRLLPIGAVEMFGHRA